MTVGTTFPTKPPPPPLIYLEEGLVNVLIDRGKRLKVVVETQLANQ